MATGFSQQIKIRKLVQFRNRTSEVPAPQEAKGEDLEYRLQQVLSAIKGAGRTEVMITYKSGKELIPAMNTTVSNIETEEQDSSGEFVE